MTRKVVGAPSRAKKATKVAEPVVATMAWPNVTNAQIVEEVRAAILRDPAVRAIVRAMPAEPRDADIDRLRRELLLAWFREHGLTQANTCHLRVRVPARPEVRAAVQGYRASSTQVINFAEAAERVRRRRPVREVSHG